MLGGAIGDFEGRQLTALYFGKVHTRRVDREQVLDHPKLRAWVRRESLGIDEGLVEYIGVDATINQAHSRCFDAVDGGPTHGHP